MNCIRDFFDKAYSMPNRYWWTNGNHYEINPALHTPMNAALLNILHKMPYGRTALDLGAGEGADAIRLAKLGFSVIAIELSSIGAEKIRRFSQEEKLNISVIEQDITLFNFKKNFDVILCHGVLHYIEDKVTLLNNIKNHTSLNGINSISCFTDYSPIPECHKIIPVYPDKENGVILQAYSEWKHEFYKKERNVPEHSHSGFTSHNHSFIKIIARKTL